MQILRRIRSWFRRRQFEAEMNAEMQAHLELQADRNRAAGMDVEEARYAAQRQFGNVASLQEQAREVRGGLWWDQLVQDVKYGGRGLRKNPLFTTVAVATLALGIALNTVAFSLYHTLLGKRLPVHQPAEIVRLSSDRHKFQASFTYDEFLELQSGLHTANALIATAPLQVMLGEMAGGVDEAQKPAAVQLVSDNYFDALGLKAITGRALRPGDREVAVISYDSWQQRFNGDPGVVGRAVRFQGQPLTIVGVAPAGFGGTTPPSAPDYWVPLAMQPGLLPTQHWLGHDARPGVWALLARRKADVTTAQVGAELAIATSGWRTTEGRPLETGVQNATFFQLDSPQVHAVCVLLLGAVGFVLLVGTVNIVNLVAARNAAREHEFATKLALGAGRGRLFRQLCTESLLLGLAGGAVGFMLAWWSCDMIHVETNRFARFVTGGTWSPFLDLQPDGLVFAYSLGLAVTAGLVAGLQPAWRASRLNLELALRRQSMGPGTAGAAGRRRGLLALQVAASMMLLAGAGVLLHGVRRALATNPGYETHQLIAVVAWSNLATATPSAEEQARKARAITDRLQGLANVVRVAGADRAPLTGHVSAAFTTDDGRVFGDCVTMNVTGEFFATLELPLVAGRTFSTEESAEAAPLVVVTQSAADRLWPGRDPLGQRLAAATGPAGNAPARSFTVVGVVRNARFSTLSDTDHINLFFPRPATALWLVRTKDAPQLAMRALRDALREVDPALPAQTAIWSMEEGPVRVQRMFSEIPAGFASLLAAFALFLAAVGIFGVVSFIVARRTREFGVRMALGADGGTLVRHVLRDALVPVLWGGSAGLLAAAGLAVLLTRLVLKAQLPDFSYTGGEFPWAALLAAAGVLLAVVTLAAWLPARRAAKVDPLVALRAE